MHMSKIKYEIFEEIGGSINHHTVTGVSDPCQRFGRQEETRCQDSGQPDNLSWGRTKPTEGQMRFTRDYTLAT